MREIRTRIAQQHGVDLTEQQVQELAARRLESILDIRTINPSLIEQLRRNAAGGRTVSVPSRSVAPPYQFEATTLYDSPRGLMRTLRRWLNPILRLFFNPNPLIQALNTQARLNVEAALREAERDQRQVEWNALHYEMLQRLVTEGSRISLEAQSLGLRVESLSAKVDFNERRVRVIEGSQHEPAEVKPAPSPVPPASAPRASAPPHSAPPHSVPPHSVPPASVSRGPDDRPAQTAAPEAAAGDAPRRRRRRRRGRRGIGPGDGMVIGGSPTIQAGLPRPADDDDADTAESDGAAEPDGTEEQGGTAERVDAAAPTISEHGATPVDRVEDVAAGSVDSPAPAAPAAGPSAAAETAATPPAPEPGHGEP